MRKLIAGLVFVLLFTVGFVSGQVERDDRRTKSWEVFYLNDTSTGYPKMRVNVIDTQGVCIYVARNYSTGEGNSPAITAVPKSQLPYGVGCQ